MDDLIVPLYEDSQLKGIYWKCPDGTILPDEHELLILGKEEAVHRIPLQRGILEELARTDRDRFPGKLNTLDPSIDVIMKMMVPGLTYDSLGMAISQMYIEAEERANRELNNGSVFG